MITARPQKNLKAAREYFGEHLRQGDYYSEGQQVAGKWFGEGVARLGLDPTAPVTAEAWNRLCENLHPLTGDRLTVRQRRMDRRVFYDFVISAPKSVSVMAFTAGDERIVAAHDRACQEAMTQLEKAAATYVRRGGKHSRRLTGEIVGASFRHDCSRALDPQLHTHFVVFNATWDASEGRWKALETATMFERIQFLTEVYRNALATGLREIGYRLRNTPNGFEIEGVSQDIVERFSKRKRAITEAEAKLVARLGKPINNNARAALAHARRQRKIRNLPGTRVQQFQREQLSEAEWRAIHGLIPTVKTKAAGKAEAEAEVKAEVKAKAEAAPAPEITASAALEFACAHLFERKSVVSEYELLQEALRYGRGAVSLEELEDGLKRHGDLIAIESALTTRETLRQEQRMVALVNDGLESSRPLNARFLGDRRLTDEQRTALRAILDSPDWVIALRGGAGTGKTFLLQEVVRGIAERHEVATLAPNTAGVEVLREKGFRDSMTVQRLLVDPAAQASVRGKVLVVDEAGLLSTRAMLDVLELARARGCRLLLCGDTRQHTGVEAGDALRVLERYSRLRAAELKSVRRQVDREYRAAIAAIAAGDAGLGLNRLERLGAVEQIPDDKRYARLAADYLQSAKEGKSALIVCPTWREIKKVTRDVRLGLQETGQLSRQETLVPTHNSLNWTTAQKQDMRLYEKGLVLTFHRPTKTFRPGDWAEVQSVGPGQIVVRHSTGKKEILTRKQARCFDVAQKGELTVAPGERLLLRANQKEAKLCNGQIVTVKKIGSTGRIYLTDGRKLDPDFRAFTHGYAVTSPGSQARAVDHVFVAMDSGSIPAANRKQFYVSVSRGREKVKIFTDDRAFVHSIVREPGTRLSAMELVERARRHQAVVEGVEQKPAMKVRV